MHGWMGKVLRVNLSSRTHSIEDLDCDFAKKYRPKNRVFHGCPIACKKDTEEERPTKKKLKELGIEVIKKRSAA